MRPGVLLLKYTPKLSWQIRGFSTWEIPYVAAGTVWLEHSPGHEGRPASLPLRLVDDATFILRQTFYSRKQRQPPRNKSAALAKVLGSDPTSMSGSSQLPVTLGLGNLIASSGPLRHQAHMSCIYMQIFELKVNMSLENGYQTFYLPVHHHQTPISTTSGMFFIEPTKSVCP